MRSPFGATLEFLLLLTYFRIMLPSTLLNTAMLFLEVQNAWVNLYNMETTSNACRCNVKKKKQEEANRFVRIFSTNIAHLFFYKP